LIAVVSILGKYSESCIRIKWHTCDLGIAAVNNKCSRERAIVCADYLITQGVDKAQS
jgi:outer membrane protein OmpA-like peptidoglycan-associated protein